MPQTNKQPISLTECDRESLHRSAQNWIGRALRTNPIVPAEIIPSIRGLYSPCFNPLRIVIASSPLAMIVAGGFAMGLTFLKRYKRDRFGNSIHPEKLTAERLAAGSSTWNHEFNATIAPHYTEDEFERLRGEEIKRLTGKYCDAVRKSPLTAIEEILYAAKYDVSTNPSSRSCEDFIESTNQNGYRRFEVAHVGAYLEQHAPIVDSVVSSILKATLAAMGRLGLYDEAIQAIPPFTPTLFDPETNWLLQLAKRLSPEYWRFLLYCVCQWSKMCEGGNVESPYEAMIEAQGRSRRFKPKDRELYWNKAAVEGSFRYMHTEFCILSDFPESILLDESGRPHCANGPSHRWRDGWALYHIHGVAVTRQIVENPETITIEQIDRESDVTVKRAMMECLGYERYFEKSGGKIVHKDKRGVLYCRVIPNAIIPTRGGPPKDEIVTMVKVRNSTPESDGTYKYSFYRVPPDIKKATLAIAWTFGLNGAAYDKGLVQET